MFSQSIDPSKMAKILQERTCEEFRLAKSLEVGEYLRKWVPKLYGIKVEERGWRERCLDELAKIMPAQRNTIDKNWGQSWENAPEYAGHICGYADFMNQLSEMMRDWEQMRGD